MRSHEILDRKFLSSQLMLKRERSFASGYEVTTHGGTRSAEKDALIWIKEAVDRGAGEILLNSMDRDGIQSGFRS